MSVESPVPGFGIGGHNNSGTGASGNGHGVAGPASWNRSLDRALDEASVTGSLNLSGRKLKEFPKSAANHDLTDTTQADLSRNRLSELPMEVCHFVSLESLNLYQNCIRQVPDSVLNLQSLSYLNISRNQLSTLPGSLCSLPLKVLIACNNKLLCLPEEIGHLRQLTELDVSCNEIQTLPSQVGQLEALRDLNIRRNHLVRLPVELAELPLVRIDFSCNKITTIPVCYRNLRHLQTIVLENNPLQSPPAQICIKGKIHIFKYLNIEACKIAPDLPEYDRRPAAFGSCHEDLYPSRTYGALDSGFNSVDSGDKRWSGNEPTDEFSDLPLRVAEIKEQRLRRESQYLESRTGTLISNGAEHILSKIRSHCGNVFHCTCESVSVQNPRSAGTQDQSFKRCSRPHEDLYPSRTYGALDSGFNSVDSGDKRWSGNEPTDEFSDLPLRVAEIKEQRLRRESQYLESRTGALVSNGAVEHDVEQIDFIDSCPTEEEDEEARTHRGANRDSLSSQFMAYIERRISHEGSPVKASTTRDSLRTDDSRRCHPAPSRNGGCASPSSPYNQNGYQPLMVFEIDSNTNTIKRRPGTHKQQNDERSPLSQSASFLQSALQSPPYPGPASPPSYRSPSHRPESFLFRAALREEVKRVTPTLSPTSPVSPTSPMSPGFDSEEPRSPQSDGELGEDSPLAEELRKFVAALAPAPDADPLFPLAVTPTLSPTSPVSPTSPMSPGFDSEEPRSPQSDGELGEDSPLAEELRKNIESRLKVSLPSDLGAALTDGVVLCHLANHVRPRSVSSIHVPSPAVPKLTMAKCRRNVENFLEACRRLGVPQAQLCLPLHILETKGLDQVAGTVQALLEMAPPKNPQLSSV
ncbi:Leucine-rich repeat and calponin homology domain-containing protein 3 [Acipenser ruthenus]|uniref:Leucine-rich repeat and calponin homology domain-containing protein 3 n=1 Tax=Acipenser ruthenus TaxID=7906 RepID=A0A444U6L7_ACIRT|nr:Leucine-rich repeat and calponin homology domain-containing protein 3 [Acipenser ruthenus]